MLSFAKLSGSGNDFILIANMDRAIHPSAAPSLAKTLCRRGFSVGADGLILLEPATLAEAHFAWRFFNADGSEAEMCGNGGRCAARFAYVKGIAPAQMVFETGAGLVRAEVMGERVKLEMTPPRDLTLDRKLALAEKQIFYSFVNTGVPHVVVEVNDIDKAPLKELGPQIRFHPQFSPAGTNVNFVALDGERIFIRTYERGVEDETLACGTGACAAALVLGAKGQVSSPVEVVTRGGEILRVYFSLDAHGPKEVFLEGIARFIYQGKLFPEALSGLSL
ncbi:diaminopimelate epimerase [Thermosulfuriphilus ammonigenes]|uniref:Diaminopimelate epimerase n=1 Tax=Thermosulfuriphilus ammonigenes TaxID=1936021 RepID=A0A6G7PVP9_9BACT|nr:diaminopimelate epimerase [Thermosulfuriphilus ammonigenes]MBA2848158.1 diaminopimelate epimerase [Thermosulfuriphilus ammonigenes]QIJ71667.1 diaminopimelate epimerase [Thermosulfuriphilus ammonigenes]